ncbi:MAG TPA: nuclear transport factor 2 family protein [Terracidiphilus sp.]|nr:nuclear transport factor 2 family protein [Terracidiphilus sp.]
MFLRNRIYLSLLAALLLCVTGFASGFIACVHAKTFFPTDSGSAALAQPGNAPPEIRGQVLESIRTLQSAYTHRDPAFLSSLMAKVMPADGEILILGTQGGDEEWARGTTETARFLTADWQSWGDVHFDVDRAVVWASGETAWVATLGDVRWKNETVRPLRFTAVLTHENGRWVFRQMQYQWNDREPVKEDLWRVHTYELLLRDALLDVLR